MSITGQNIYLDLMEINKILDLEFSNMHISYI